METHRKPYIRPVRATWWTARKEYIFYMIREATALCSLWVGIELMAFCLAAVLCDDPHAWITARLTHPVILALNILSLPAVFYHTYTWYKIFPKGVRLFTSRDPANTRLIPAPLLTASLYVVTLAASVVILLGLHFA